ncbi:uncharacterized protein At5g39865-like [Macadamia integrifolia]|uniref:uncharacterized protein At5g39865-like n=1 Tax=Macadamia integrifolia TaxID=60698 RepID=UPI001C4F0F05|nr:uncharacterized protein At5g39865-like [Macadamia integrifolia]
MGCISSTLFNHDDEFSQFGRPGLGHHIVSLTSTTYGLLTLDPPPPLSPSPNNDDLHLNAPIPPRFALDTLFPNPLPEPSSLRSQPEVINSWELMAGLDTAESSRSSPSPTPPSIPSPSLFSLLHTVSELDSPMPRPSKPFSFKHHLIDTNKENSNPNRHLSTAAAAATAAPDPDPGNVFCKYSLDGFERRCPPNGESKVVVYTTTLRCVRRTFEACNAVRAALEGLGVLINERDVSMDRGFREELRELMNGKDCTASVLPRVFVKGRYVGGAEEVLRIHEEGCLGQLLEGLPMAARVGDQCEGCGGVRFLPCFGCSGSCKVVMVVNEEHTQPRGEQEREVVVRCPDCNENGLVLCPICS